MTPPEDSEVPPLRHAELPEGRTLVVRRATASDSAALMQLYRRLSPRDLQRRFLTSGVPPRKFVESWVNLWARGGVVLVAELLRPGLSPRVVAEAGCAPMRNGDAELGITVDPEHRGWLGPWLLDAVLEEADHAGFANVEALIASDNNQMRSMLQRRGAAGAPTDDWSTARYIVSSSGRTPSWPPVETERRRLLVEAPSVHWPGIGEAEEAGYDVIVCTAPKKRGGCPLLATGSCPLVEGADAVILGLRPGTQARNSLDAAHDKRGSGPPTVRQVDCTAAAATSAVGDLPNAEDSA